MVLAVF